MVKKYNPENLSYHVELTEPQLTTVVSGMAEGLLRWSKGGHGRVAPVSPELLRQHLDMYAKLHRVLHDRGPDPFVLDFLRGRWRAGAHAGVIENARRSW